MSFLAPLYLLGGLAVSLPILFHLIRRRPKGEVVFSSLMFLQPTPPRLTRRSRLENIALLVVRALALLLLAAAFSRPFFNQNTTAERDIGGMKTVLLIDTSASMRQTGVWQAAVDRALGTIADLKPTDQIGIIAFDQKPRVLLSLSDSIQLTAAQRVEAARAEIKSLQPTWFPTEMAEAVRFAAEHATTSSLDKSSKEASDRARLVLISDMQVGANINPLQTYDWPKELSLKIDSVEATSTANAAARILQDKSSSAETVRVRVVNSRDSIASQFRLRWKGKVVGDASQRNAKPGPADRDSLPFQIPPGQSRIVSLPKPSDAKITRLELTGDEQDFDNQQFYAVTPRSISTILFLSENDRERLSAEQTRESLLYYLDRIPLSDARREIKIVRTPLQGFSKTENPRKSPLVFVAGKLANDVSKPLKRFVEDGGTVCVVLDDKDYDSPALRSLLDSPDLRIDDADVDDYSMLDSIRFRDPMFVAMSDPQFNDFTKVRIWQHRTITGINEDFQVVAEFDNDTPAILRRDTGKGSIVVFAFGWQPSQSQLALSTKFIPMIAGLVSPEQTEPTSQFVVGGPIDLPIDDSAKITRPDGESVDFAAESDKMQIDTPGIYQYTSDDADLRFAVNVAESESLTDSLESGTLERLGVKIGDGKTAEEKLSAADKRQLMDVELESRQKVWQWLLLGAFAALAIETWWSRRLMTKSEPVTEVAET